jgi:hypothetical protein
MSDVRYVLHPGLMHSASDRDVHFIGVAQLRSLYLIPPKARVLVRPLYEDKIGRRAFDMMYQKQPGDIQCGPRYLHTDYPRFKGDGHE